MPSFLNGVALPWVYCVDYWDDVAVPGTYFSATVTHDGTVTASTAGFTGAGVKTDSSTHQINNVGQVAWLLSQYASTATVDQIALQAAIWHVIYGDKISLDVSHYAGSQVLTDYNTYLTGLGTGNISEFDWITPGPPFYGVQGANQAVVTPHVPDGGMTLMLLGGALVGLETLRRKFRA
jgi:hypothetical protein